MKKLLPVLGLLICVSSLQAQKLIVRNGHIWFYSQAPLEDIEAHNHQVTSVIDMASGNMAFAVLMKAFQFEKALMQEHFNEKYIESDKYPKASFKGSISNFKELDLSKDGTYDVKVIGELSIHGVSKEVQADGKLIISEGKLSATSTFPLRVADYEIKIPAVVRDNIAKIVDVHLEMDYGAMEK